MNISQIYIAVSIVVLAVLAFLVFLVNKNRLTPLASLAFAFVLAGIFFGANRSIGYGLMGVGVLFAVTDIFNKSQYRQLTPKPLTWSVQVNYLPSRGKIIGAKRKE